MCCRFSFKMYGRNFCFLYYRCGIARTVVPPLRYRENSCATVSFGVYWEPAGWCHFKSCSILSDSDACSALLSAHWGAQDLLYIAGLAIQEIDNEMKSHNQFNFSRYIVQREYFHFLDFREVNIGIERYQSRRKYCIIKLVLEDWGSESILVSRRTRNCHASVETN